MWSYLLWEAPLHTLILVLVINFALALTVIFRMSFTSIVCDFLFVYIFLGICINYITDTLGYCRPSRTSKTGKASAEPPKDDNYKYVSEETVQGLVFVGYCFYKRALGLFKDIVFARNFSNTLIVQAAFIW